MNYNGNHPLFELKSRTGSTNELSCEMPQSALHPLATPGRSEGRSQVCGLLGARHLAAAGGLRCGDGGGSEAAEDLLGQSCPKASDLMDGMAWEDGMAWDGRMDRMIGWEMRG